MPGGDYSPITTGNKEIDPLLDILAKDDNKTWHRWAHGLIVRKAGLMSPEKRAGLVEAVEGRADFHHNTDNGRFSELSSEIKAVS